MTQVNPVATTPLAGAPTNQPEDSELPAESIRIRIDDDGVLDWLDSLHHRPVYERDDSTKGTTNPKAQHHSHKNPNPNPNSSQRFSGNLRATTKAQIIGLPGAAINSGYLGHSSRRFQPPPPPPIFPPKKGAVSDPGSPKVSCFGIVRPDGDLQRRSPPGEEGGGGCWMSLMAWLRSSSPAKAEEANGVVLVAEERKSATLARTPRGVPAVAADPPAGLGGMRKFVSGRRSASWGGDVEVDIDGGSSKEEGHVTSSYG